MDTQNKSNKSQLPGNDDDFSTSMAKLAEMASKDLGPDKPKQENSLQVDDEMLKEFMRPKRKAKAKTFKDKWADKTIKLKINPYVASGIMIVILSGGIIAAPKISEYYKQKEIAAQAEKIKAEEIANNTDSKLKTYSVFDAAKDVSGGNTTLKVQTVSELAASVEEGNKIAALKEEENRLAQLTMNTLSLEAGDIQISLLDDTELSDSALNEDTSTEESLLDQRNYAANWDLADINEFIKLDFSLSENCTSLTEEYNWESGIITDKICS